MFRPGRNRYPIFRLALGFFFLAEVLSLYGHIYPLYATIVFIIIIALALSFAELHFDLAVMLLMAELFVGSQGGYLFSVGERSGLQLSLRIGLFLVVVGVWCGRSLSGLFSRDPVLRSHAWDWLHELRERGLIWPLATLFAACGYGVINGLWRGHGYGNVFFDANGYVYLAAFPAILAGLARPDYRRRIRFILAAAVTWSFLKALIVYFVFTHRMLTAAPRLYAWVRDARVGEITRMTGDFYRIFFQSHLWALPVLFVTVFMLATRPKPWSKSSWAPFGLYIVAMTSVVMGFSRSFWFGCLTAAAIGFVVLARSATASRVWWRLTGLLAVGVVLATIILSLTYVWPWPRRGAEISFAALIGGRALSLEGEAAIQSRWALLPELMRAGWEHPLLGSGFGRTVTYRTSDPRLLADIPTGEYTTYAFEWGYQDIWVKLGLVGLLAYFWLIIVILLPYYRYWRHGWPAVAMAADQAGNEKTALAAGIFSAVVAMLGANVFSPYLNHPLGIGLLALAAAQAAAFRLPAPSAPAVGTVRGGPTPGPAR